MNSKAKKYWKRKGANNNKEDVASKEGKKADVNPFEALATENTDKTNGDDTVLAEQATQIITEAENDGSSHQDILINTSSGRIHGASIHGKGVTIGNQDCLNTTGIDLNDTFLGNLFCDSEEGLINTHIAAADLGASISSSPSSLSKSFSSVLNATMSAPSFVSTASTSYTAMSSASPYSHLAPPSHFILPPPPNVRPSTASPLMSSSMSGKQKGSKKKQQSDDDDLNDGLDYRPEDVMPATNSRKSGRHTRNNPTYMLGSLQFK